MTSYLIDVNVWLAMTWDLHPQHGAASRWYLTAEKSDDARFLFCRFTMLGFLRLLTNRAVMGDSVLDVDGALRLYDSWTSDPRVERAGEPPGVDKAFRSALAPITTRSATKAIADCYLAGFAASAGANLVTLDKALWALTRSQHVPATLIPAVHSH